jgi:hypothetical protein
MTPLRRSLKALAFSLVTATHLGAQTLPLPVPPLLPPPPPPRPWEYTFGVGIGWDGNIDFAVPDGPGGVAITPRGSLARLFRFRAGEMHARAGGDTVGYPDRGGLHRYNAELDLDGTYRQSSTTDWRASASRGLGYTDSSRILIEQGVSLPQAKMRWTTGALGVSHKAGARTALRADGRYYRTEFDDSGLVDGNSFRGTLGLQRQIDARSNATLEYALERVASEGGGRPYLTHFGSVRWTRVLSLRNAFLLEGGASYTPEAARAGLERKESFFGGASLRRAAMRSTLTLFLRREVTPAFGIGVSRQELRAGMAATLPFGRAWELRAAATHVRPDAANSVAGPYGSSDDAFATLIRRLGRRVELSAEARYRRRGAMGTIPMVESFQAGLFVTVPTASAAVVPAN